MIECNEHASCRGDKYGMMNRHKITTTCDFYVFYFLYNLFLFCFVCVIDLSEAAGLTLRLHQEEEITLADGANNVANHGTKQE